MRRAAGFALLLLLVAATAAAAEEPLTLAALGLKGQAIFKNYTSFETTANDRHLVVDEGILQVEWARRLGAWGATKLIVEFRDDDFGFTRGLHFQIPETSQRRSYLGVREATFSARRGPLEVTLGKQIYAWGTADAFNPTDNLNPYDYLNVLDNEKLGVWSASARLSLGPASLVFAVVPFFTPSRLPLPRSRWTPPVPPGFVAVADDPVRPDQDIGATQYAARLKTTVAGWDVSVSYYDGFDHTPSFRQSAFQVPPGVVIPRLTPVYSRVKVPGLDFSTTFGKLPTVKKPKRIAASGKKNRFLGTDFSYEDLRAENVTVNTYALVGSEAVDGVDCLVIDATPATERQASDSGYSRRRIRVRKDTLVTVKREYYDKKAQLEKVETHRKLVNVTGPVWRADEIEMHDVVNGTRTVITVETRAVNRGLKDDFFTETELVR